MFVVKRVGRARVGDALELEATAAARARRGVYNYSPKCGACPPYFEGMATRTSVGSLCTLSYFRYSPRLAKDILNVH